MSRIDFPVFSSPGPGYETPAEIRMLRVLDAMSCITNLAGLSPNPLDHSEVRIATAGRVEVKESTIEALLPEAFVLHHER
jgi:purine nucleoside phosphorylase